MDVAALVISAATLIVTIIQTARDWNRDDKSRD